jgi:hypothetical protein
MIDYRNLFLDIPPREELFAPIHIENKRVNVFIKITLTIILAVNYCGVGHFCPWRLFDA